MHGKDAADILFFLAIPFTFALPGLGITVRLANAEIQKAAVHCIDVKYRTKRRPANGVILIASILVHESGGLESYLIIYPCHRTTSDQDILLRLCLLRCAPEQEIPSWPP